MTYYASQKEYCPPTSGDYMASLLPDGIKSAFDCFPQHQNMMIPSLVPPDHQASNPAFPETRSFFSLQVHGFGYRFLFSLRSNPISGPQLPEPWTKAQSKSHLLARHYSDQVRRRPSRAAWFHSSSVRQGCASAPSGAHLACRNDILSIRGSLLLPL
jgi:hypothetical protein